MHAPPLHVVLPAGHAQRPFWQVVLLPQWVPQVPQLVLSAAKSTQALPHDDWFEAQPQRPALQVWFAGHAWPQLPQLVLSVCRSTHDPLQYAWPDGHTHWPD